MPIPTPPRRPRASWWVALTLLAMCLFQLACP